MDKLARLKELQQQHQDITAEIATLKEEIMGELNINKRPRKKKE